jgi:hypothetical protein
MWSQRTIFECWPRWYVMLGVDFKRLNRVVAGNGEGGMPLTAHLTQHTQEDKKQKNLAYSTFSSYSSQFIINKWFYNSTLESRKCWNSVRNVGHPSLTNAAPHPRRTETTTTGPTWHSSHSPLSRTALCGHPWWADVSMVVVSFGRWWCGWHAIIVLGLQRVGSSLYNWAI